MMFKLIKDELHTVEECTAVLCEKGICTHINGKQTFDCHNCEGTGEVYTKVYIPKPVIPAGTVSNRTRSDIKLHNHYVQQLAYKAVIEKALRVRKPKVNHVNGYHNTADYRYDMNLYLEAQTTLNQFSINNGDIIKE